MTASRIHRQAVLDALAELPELEWISQLYGMHATASFMASTIAEDPQPSNRLTDAVEAEQLRMQKERMGG
jgi:hypothetical protein